MPDENEQKKERSKISVRIGEVQVELEGTYDNIKKLMGKELFDLTKALQETPKQVPSSTEITPKVTPKPPEITPKAPEVTPKEKIVPPPIKPSTTPEVSSPPSRVPTIEKTTEKGGPKKIFGKTMVITLGIICIVLAAGLVSALAVYMPMVSNLESQIAEQDNTISSLNLQISSLNLQVSSLQDDLEQANNTISSYTDAIQTYNSRIAYYMSIISLNESGYLFQPATQTLTQEANASTVVYNDILQYAGYVSVGVESNSTTTYVRVVYSYSEVNYDYNMTVGTSGTAAFPVLPGGIQIIVGNTESVNATSATVTALYRY